MFGPVAMLALASASFSCVAIVAMKSWWNLPSPSMAFLIAAAVLIAAVFEVAALREERLGLIYVGILGAEVVILGAASIWLFGETYSYREVAGIGLVLFGTAIAWS